jgi:hypothetical protein
MTFEDPIDPLHGTLRSMDPQDYEIDNYKSFFFAVEVKNSFVDISFDVIDGRYQLDGFFPIHFTWIRSDHPKWINFETDVLGKLLEIGL